MNIRLLILDVDGVLTDGRFLLHGDDGEAKAFHTADGLGLRLLMDAGVQVAFLTGRDTPVVQRRGSELGVQTVMQGRNDKLAAAQELLENMGLKASDMAYMGDDLPDLPAMKIAGLAAVPADARPEVRAIAKFVAPSNGGQGAVRDLCEHLLREMGLWDAIVARYSD